MIALRLRVAGVLILVVSALFIGLDGIVIAAVSAPSMHSTESASSIAQLAWLGLRICGGAAGICAFWLRPERAED